MEGDRPRSEIEFAQANLRRKYGADSHTLPHQRAPEGHSVEGPRAKPFTASAQRGRPNVIAGPKAPERSRSRHRRATITRPSRAAPRRPKRPPAIGHSSHPVGRTAAKAAGRNNHIRKPRIPSRKRIETGRYKPVPEYYFLENCPRTGNRPLPIADPICFVLYTARKPHRRTNELNSTAHADRSQPHLSYWNHQERRFAGRNERLFAPSGLREGLGGSEPSSHPLPAPPKHFRIIAHAPDGIAGERLQILVNRVQDIDREREERVLHLIRRRDPVAGAHHHRRRVQVVEGELRDLRRHRLQHASPLARVRAEQDAPRLLHALQHQRVVERDDAPRV